MSVSSVSLSTDVNARYERLASEYTKLRSQAKVLRDGVLSERAKADSLGEKLNAAEALVRKLQTENESLQFRNDQLVKRVENLQDEVEVASFGDGNKKEKAKEKKSVPKDVKAHLQLLTQKVELLEEELKNKLRQNEDLVSKMAENDQRHQDELAEMGQTNKRQLRELEMQLDALQRTQAKRSASFSQHAESPKKPHGPDTEDVTNRKTSRNPFDERLSSSGFGDEAMLKNEDVANALKEPPFVESPPPPPTSEAVVQAAETAHHVLQGFANLFNLLRQRTEIYPFDATMETLPNYINKLAAEFGQCSHLFNDPVRVIAACIQNANFDMERDLIALSSPICLISRHCSTLLPELMQRLSTEENKVTWSSRQLEKMNEDWMNALLKLFDGFKLVGEILRDVDSEGRTTNPLEELILAFTNLSDACRDLNEVFHARWLHESRFPTSTKRMRCVGSALADCLQVLAVETTKLHARVATIAKLVAVEVSTKAEANQNSTFEDEPSARDVERSTNELEQRAEVDPNINNRTHAVCEKCRDKDDEACGEAQKAADYEGCEETNEYAKLQVTYYRERVAELEAERDKQIVEVSLLRRRLETLNSDAVVLIDSKEVQAMVTAQLRAIRTERRGDVLDRIENAECAFRFYQAECQALLRMNGVLENDKYALQAKVHEMEDEHVKVEEELAIVRRGYEAQLAQLSDHVAGLVADAQERKRHEIASGSVKEKLAESRTGLKSFFKG